MSIGGPMLGQMEGAPIPEGMDELVEFEYRI